MIKINLLRNFNAATVPVHTAGGISYGEVSTADRKVTLLKLLIILLLPASLKVYEDRVIEEKGVKANQLRGQLTSINTELEKLGSVVEVVSRFEKEREKLQERLNVIESLAVNRLLEVIVLDRIQEIIPPRAWLQLVSINADKARIEGIALSEKDILDFVEKMEADSHFSNVIFTSVSDSSGLDKQRRKFEITFDVKGG